MTPTTDKHDNDTQALMDRRQFIKLSAIGLATTAVGIGVAGGKLHLPALAPEQAAASGPVGESAHKWVMVIDQRKCIGCDLCISACKAYNDVAPDMIWGRVDPDEPVNSQPVFRPVPCMHCDEPPCVEVCPVAATYKRADGIVMMDYERCIGCRYCQLSCPYGSRTFNWERFTETNPLVPEFGQPEVARRPRGVVEKCTFCYQRIDRGLAFGMTPGVDAAATPACVVICPQDARHFGDLNDPNSKVSKLIAENKTYRLYEELGTEPRVYYIPADEEQLS